MPIVRQWRVFDHCQVALWQLTETPDELQQNLVATPDEWAEYAGIAHPQKQREWLAGRRAVQTLVENNGLIYSGLVKDEFGKPHLRAANAELSFTHTTTHVAAVIHPTRPIGIDMERLDDKLRRVAKKFMSEGELRRANNDLARLATYWCAKEALYKLHGTKKLRFREDIPIADFLDDTELLTGQIMHHDHAKKHLLHRFWVADLCGILAL